jgi:hypothetical protein
MVLLWYSTELPAIRQAQAPEDKITEWLQKMETQLDKAL